MNGWNLGIAVALLLALAGAGGSARADEFPARKPGLWEVTTSGAGPRTRVVRLCLDVATEAEMIRKGLETRREICSRSEVKRSGATITDDSVCKPMSSQVTAHAVTTLDGDGSYSTVINTQYDPPFMGRTTSTTTQTGKWLGACGADLQPGEALVDGQKLKLGGGP
jgi:hypothetical protein